MRIRAAAVVSAVMVGALVIGGALAASVHYKSGPTFTENGLTLTASGALAGLGNADVTIKLTATGTADRITCTNPGGNTAPGQNRPRQTTVGQVVIPAPKIKNGNVSFSVTTAGPGPISAKTAGCPNNNWTARIDHIDFTSATLQFFQNNKLVLETIRAL
jgi:hypothetical protein